MRRAVLRETIGVSAIPQADEGVHGNDTVFEDQERVDLDLADGGVRCGDP